ALNAAYQMRHSPRAMSVRQCGRRSEPVSAAETAAGRPLPLSDAASEQYWAAAREHRLAFPFCTTCQRWFHPVYHACPAGHEATEYRELTGRGRVYTFTTVRDRSTAGFEPPYLVALVKLVE